MEPDNSGGNELIEQQIAQNNVEIEQKRKALTDERFSIIKSQGGQNWSPTPLPTVKKTPQDIQKEAYTKMAKSQTIGEIPVGYGGGV